MSRVTCRCGEKLEVPAGAPERIDCSRCGAKIRLRRSARPEETDAADDGYLRFYCPCGRRLKVPAAGRPAAGKCPDCGRVVPVPETAWSTTDPGPKSIPGDPEARTEELDANDLTNLEKWAEPHLARAVRDHKPLSTMSSLIPIVAGGDPGADVGVIAPSQPAPSAVRFEAGLRICPRCKKPVHLGAPTCRACGTPVPRQ